MNLKKKLSWGLGFLFLIIFFLVIFSALEIGKLSQDAANILKDNYASLVYAKNMDRALDDMEMAVSSRVLNPAEQALPAEYHLKLFEGGRAEFERNLKAEQGNVTESHEKEFVDSLTAEYATYLNLGQELLKGQGGGQAYFREWQPANISIRESIGRIYSLNMQAVEHKNDIAKNDSARIITLMAVVGVFALILAFVYFWYFPFYVSNSVSYLSARMRDLLKKHEIQMDIRTEDESHIILQGINLLEEKLSEGKKGKKSSQPKGTPSKGW